jgi:hypothetical protein
MRPACRSTPARGPGVGLRSDDQRAGRHLRLIVTLARSLRSGARAGEVRDGSPAARSPWSSLNRWYTFVLPAAGKSPVRSEQQPSPGRASGETLSAHDGDVLGEGEAKAGVGGFRSVRLPAGAVVYGPVVCVLARSCLESRFTVFALGMLEPGQLCR